ncbi:Ets domain and Winged helix-turn-helix DNA-binding domain-containing protein [Strongyloides ratti]|uniref:Ets domain and Winged helix-turn-helix DNA-binding domain-containing protein n=1 Tax=Strongyloides ratti TaxID=34506 RepID=A0A090KX62_STRRB|nr:Ets domain and Winged helix-turn-helix DNA-binding domain-containing protein [Strongyloides ratti]CEF60462.1 Ets domain and Winged helix-turn-helix DNA-binding domain-containing protein [Strongyloides ratti]
MIRMSYINQASFCGNYSSFDDQYPNNCTFNNSSNFKNYDYFYEGNTCNGYQNTPHNYCIPTQDDPDYYSNQQSPINLGYQNTNDVCYGTSSTPSSNSSSSFISQGTPDYNSFTSNNSDNTSLNNYCEYPVYQDCSNDPPISDISNNSNINNYECCDSIGPSISNISDYQNYQDSGDNFNCTQNSQLPIQTGNEYPVESYQSPLYQNTSGYSQMQNFSQINTYCQNQIVPFQETLQNCPEESCQNITSNQDVIEDINMMRMVDYPSHIQKPLTVEISNFILSNINSIFLNFTIRLLSNPKYQTICFWSRISWEFIIADPLAFTKVFADEYNLNRKYMTFSHVSKAYKIVEASTIYGQHIITRVKSKRNTWRFFPDHNKMGFPSLRNAGGSTLAGTILNAEEMKFLTKLRKKLSKIPCNEGTLNTMMNNDYPPNCEYYETPRIRRY